MLPLRLNALNMFFCDQTIAGTQVRQTSENRQDMNSSNNENTESVLCSMLHLCTQTGNLKLFWLENFPILTYICKLYRLQDNSSLPPSPAGKVLKIVQENLTNEYILILLDCPTLRAIRDMCLQPWHVTNGYFCVCQVCWLFSLPISHYMRRHIFFSCTIMLTTNIYKYSSNKKRRERGCIISVTSHREELMRLIETKT